MKSANSSSRSRARSGSVRTKLRDRAQGVVDEVRADLGPQRAHLGLHQPGRGWRRARRARAGRRPTARPRRRRGPGRRSWSARTPAGCRRPAPSTTSGLTTAVRTGQPASSHAQVAAGRTPRVVAAGSTMLARQRAGAARAWWSPAPSQASRSAVSVSASAGVPSRAAQVPDRSVGAVGGQPLPQRGRGERGAGAGCGTSPGRPRCRGGRAASMRQTIRRRIVGRERREFSRARPCVLPETAQATRHAARGVVALATRLRDRSDGGRRNVARRTRRDRAAATVVERPSPRGDRLESGCDGRSRRPPCAARCSRPDRRSDQDASVTAARLRFGDPEEHLGGADHRRRRSR